jgi:hypothetical protein
VKVVRERADARWLPSRHRFAIFRLIAWALFRRMGPTREPGLALGIDRDQSALESYVVATWIMASATCFTFALLDRVLLSPVAAVLAPISAVIALQVFVVAPGLVKAWRDRDNTGINSFITMLVMSVTALYLIQEDHWSRSVAWFFLVCLGVNALASIVAWLMRNRFAAMENELITS